MAATSDHRPEPKDGAPAGSPAGELAEPGTAILAALSRVRTIADELAVIGRSAAALSTAELPPLGPGLPDELEPAELAQRRRQAAALGPWPQGPFRLAGNLVIAADRGNHLIWRELGPHVGNLSGQRVLDVRCQAGYDPFMFRLRGAAEVLACEPSKTIGQARFLESILSTGVDFQPIGWTELDPSVHGRFDLVHCAGVLHLERDPLRLLDRLRALTAPAGRLLLAAILHSAGDASEYLRLVPEGFAGDDRWRLVPGRLAMRWMLERAGFEVRELWLAEGPRGEFPTLQAYYEARPVAEGPPGGAILTS